MITINLTPNTVVPQEKVEYSEFIAELEASGIDTTTIHYDRGEADFSVYGAALSPELQAQLIEYNNDNEYDDELQQQVAGLFQNDNAYDNADFAKACREMGFQVEYSTVKTTMIPDNKGSSGINRNVEQHHLTSNV